MNKKADINIVVLVLLLVISLSLIEWFNLAKNKKNTDTATIDTSGLDALYSQETQLQAQLAEMAEKSAILSYNNIMNNPYNSFENGILSADELLLTIDFKIKFIYYFNSSIEDYLKTQNELNSEIQQIKNILNSNPYKIIRFEEDGNIWQLNLREIKITAASYKNNQEIFNAVYTANFLIETNLTKVGLSPPSTAYFIESYTKCKNEQEMLPCLNTLIPQFIIKFDYNFALKEATQPNTKITLQPEPTKYDYKLIYLNLTTKRKFIIGNEYKTINFKILVDVEEIK